MAPLELAFMVQAVVTPDDISAIKSLFTAYTESLHLDLTFQDYTTEFSSLPGKYGPPSGALLLACSTADAKTPLGCVALRDVSTSANPKRGEIKRLHIAPEARGLGLGKMLAGKVVEEARRLGYNKVVLDTLGSMTAALGLYGSMGFERVDAYYETPLEGTVFLRLNLI